MFTQCPHCDTVFRVGAEQLRAAQGRVRCGQCQGVFDALAHLYDQLPDEEPAAPENVATPSSWESPEPEPEPEHESELRIRAIRDEPGWGESSSEEPAAAAPVSEVADSAVTALRVDIEEMLGTELEVPPEPLARRRSFGWSLLAILLVVVLAGQYLYFLRGTLTQYDAVRPWLQRLCTVAGCELPLRRAVDRIELMNRDVISHPRIRSALLVTATFVNRAAFAQPYPVVQITLSDESGAVVAMRRFQPEDYLAPGAALAAGMAPGAPVHLVLEVAEPRKHATSFQFDFL